jgi:lipopolysaccharide export system protein LptC
MTTTPLTSRRPVFSRLARRNRIVAVLRLGVPLAGVALFVGLVAQIVLANIGARFGIGQVTISPDAITIDAPEYAGVMADGSSYRVWAASARAPLARTDLLDLTDGVIVVNRVDGVELRAEAAESQLDTAAQTVAIPDRADFTYSSGTTGIIYDTVVDWNAQTVTARGRTDVDYADGTTVRAQGLHYDAAAMRWTFSHAVVTLPSTPGESLP